MEVEIFFPIFKKSFFPTNSQAFDFVIFLFVKTDPFDAPNLNVENGDSEASLEWDHANCIEGYEVRVCQEGNMDRQARGGEDLTHFCLWRSPDLGMVSVVVVCGKQTMERSMLFSCWDYFLFSNLLEIQRFFIKIKL